MVFGPLPAKLQRDALEGFGRAAQDFPAVRRGSGEGHLRDVRMPAEFRQGKYGSAFRSFQFPSAKKANKNGGGRKFMLQIYMLI